MPLWELFQKSFQEHSVLWLILSASVGGLIGALIKFLFEQVFGPHLQRKRTGKFTVKKNLCTILKSVYKLERRLDNMIRFADEAWFEDPDENYYKLSTLYVFGCFFGWIKILEDESFTESAQSDRWIKKFYDLYRITKMGINGFKYFEKVTNFHSLLKKHEEEIVVHEYFIIAMGELMIVHKDKIDESLPSMLNFTQFASKYINSEEYTNWFNRLTKFLYHIRNVNGEYDKKLNSVEFKFNRLIIIDINLQMFIEFLDPKHRYTRDHRIRYINDLHPAVQKKVREEIADLGYSHLIDEESTSIRHKLKSSS